MTFKFKDIGGVPSNPPAGYVGLYCNGGVLYWIDESGTTTSIASGTGDLLANGSVPLTADWDVGAFQITALRFHSDEATLSPFTVASSAVVTNLNADLLDGNEATAFATAAQGATADAAVAGTLFDANTILKADADNTPLALTVAEQTLVGRITAGSIAALTATQVRTLLNVEDGATADQTGAEIKAAYEAEADTNAYTDAAVAIVAAAVVDGDFSGSDGFMRKTGAGAYEVVKANMAATAAPNPATDDSSAGYAVGSTWWDTTNDEVYLCIDATAGAAVWKQVGSGTGGGGGLTPVFKSAAYTAAANEKVFCLTATAATAFTITLPASPSSGEAVSVWDAEDSAQDYNVTIARNGQTIQGAAEDFVLNVSGGRVDLAFDGTTWQLSYTTPGASGFTGAKRVFIPVLEMIEDQTNTPGALTRYQGASVQIAVNYRSFDASIIERLMFALCLPPSWNGGAIRWRAYWLNLSSTNTGNVLWRVGTKAIENGENVNQSMGATSDSVDAGPGTANLLNISPWASLSITDAADDALTFGHISRIASDGSDTFTADAGLIGIELEYTTDAPTDD